MGGRARREKQPEWGVRSGQELSIGFMEGRGGEEKTSEMDEVEVRTKQCDAKKEVRRSEERRGHATSEKPPFCVFLCALPTFFVSLFTALLLVSAGFQVLPSSVSVSESRD